MKKTTKKQQKDKINELLSRLSSAYQEQAINEAIESLTSGEYTYTRQEFADECCNNYRDILKGLDLKDIYKGFRLYGDEGEVQFIAFDIFDILTNENPTPTNKQHFNNIVKKAEAINRHLNKLRKECKALIDDILDHADNYDSADYEFELALLEETLGDLSSFDLEDSIPEKHTINY